MSHPPARQESDATAQLHGEIRAVPAHARSSVAQSVNVAMVHAYWHIGSLIDAHVNVGSRSETYGAQLLTKLSKRLRAEFGPGFEPTNLEYMRQFFEAFDIGHAPRGESSGRIGGLQITVELSWTHYRLLTNVHRVEARRYYLDEAVAGRWSTRELGASDPHPPLRTGPHHLRDATQRTFRRRDVVGRISAARPVCVGVPRSARSACQE